jgi:hypothetical protein
LTRERLEHGETVADLWGGYADAARSRVWAPDTIVNDPDLWHRPEAFAQFDE